MIYSKRVAFIISSQHLIPHGGIGQFCKGFVEMASRLLWKVDVILDKAFVRSDLVDHISKYVNFISPTEDLSYKKHTKAFAFSESYNLEKCINFRDSLMKAFQTNLYDLIVINTPEGLISTYSLGLSEYIPTVFYTHNENLVFKNNAFKGVFNDSYDEFFGMAMKCSGIIVGTQTGRNAIELESSGLNDPKYLPMPMPEIGLLEDSSDIEKSGVLFIGRWEERKNPKEFLRVIEETRLPAKVMTNENGAKNFEGALKRIGVPYEIKISVVGKEKVDFIKGSKVFFMPSKSESYGFALFESLGHCHSVVLDQYDWHTNFDHGYLTISSKKNVVDDIKFLYNLPIENNKSALKYVRDLSESCDTKWNKLVCEFQSKKSTSNAALVNEFDNFFYEDFIEGLNRFASTEDIISVLGNRHKYITKYTDNKTFLSKEGQEPKEQEEISLDDIF